MAEVFIALGSNLGDREANLREAQAAIASAVAILARSSVHETRPQYVEDQPPFLNMVLRGTTSLEPEALLSFLQKIEKNLRRKPSRRFGPRLIDLDILYHGDKISNNQHLVLPHPRIAERDFVLLPMAEIAPERRHPVTGKTTAEMLEALRSGQ
ncbi:MAG: 2-amino-4-hydroxy-6-hydroxymethyldihydropteridine diphosphokinase [Alphaproteobacteria bacterium]|nr:2-amino-4-hydroxy-6-hydroxymethyldihydropteridine diphosphokinase [Alphaproteobacteria bacterium]